jgi:hypothetical protein
MLTMLGGWLHGRGDLRAKAWAPILQDEEVRALMLPLLVLGSDDELPLFGATPGGGD